MTRYRKLLLLTGPAIISIAASIVAVWPGVVAQLGFQPFVDYLMFDDPSEGYKYLSRFKGLDFVDYLFTIHAACLLVGVPVITFTTLFSLLYIAIPMRHHTKALKQTKYFDHPAIQPGFFNRFYPYTWVRYVLVTIFILFAMMFYLNAPELIFDDHKVSHGFGIAMYIGYSATMPMLAYIIVNNPHLIVARKIIKGPNTKRGKSLDK